MTIVLFPQFTMKPVGLLRRIKYSLLPWKELNELKGKYPHGFEAEVTGILTEVWRKRGDLMLACWIKVDGRMYHGVLKNKTKVNDEKLYYKKVHVVWGDNKDGDNFAEIVKVIL